MIDEFRTYKPEIVRVNLSTPFLVRSRCKFCAGLPTHYYYIRNATMWYNPRKPIDHFKQMTKYVKRMCSDHYLMEEPKYFVEMASFSHPVSYKGYRPRLHRTRGSSATQDVVEFLMCDCGRSSWAFSDKAVKYRPEIVARKARYRFPQKFEF